jgi:hypothetical protein
VKNYMWGRRDDTIASQKLSRQRPAQIYVFSDCCGILRPHDCG